ncbi:MAG TPA: hypothetical protein VMD57_01645, partial [Candidatus Baltobacteraceae bacterium]|nr:hypothetical protein [Candidatus Baltobacteraceae bacterium]
MSQWVINGIRAGIKTTAYPVKPETADGVTPGLPVGGVCPANQIASLIERCPTDVFSLANGMVTADVRRCIHCYRCVREIERPARWQQTYEWGTIRNGQHEFDQPFERS